MGMFSEIATESTINEIVGKLLPLYDAATGDAKEAYRISIMKAMECFDWSAPDWSTRLAQRLKEEKEHGIRDGVHDRPAGGP